MGYKAKLSNGKQCDHGICRAHLSIPCLICGQTDHSLVEWRNEEQRKWIACIACPVARYNSWEEMCTEKDDRKKYSFGAENFLSQYGYNAEEVMNAFQIYEERGYGQAIMKSYPILHRASRSALLAVCENARLLHHFKRECSQPDDAKNTGGGSY